MKNLNRWVYAIVGVIVLLFAGIIYAWSILSLPIAQEFEQWTKLQLSMTFTIAMIAFCLSGLCGGIMIGRGIPVRVNIALAAVLVFIGFMVSASAQSPMQLYIGFGVLVGLGSGFAYNGVLSTMSKWFPDKQGLISGVLLMGFGLGSFIIGKVYQSVVPSLDGTWRTAFRFMGVFIAAILVLAIPFFVKPDASKMPTGAAKKAGGADFAPAAMLKTSSFYLYYIWAILLSAAGLVLVSQASGILKEVAPATAAGVSSTVVGLISICNGIGRVIFGNLFDKKGFRLTMNLVIGGFVITAVILMLAITSGQFALVVLGFVLGGFSYGGVTPTNSAISNDFFGAKNYSINFSIVGSNLIFASFGSSIAGALYDASGSYYSSMLMIIGAAALGFFALLVMRRPKGE